MRPSRALRSRLTQIVTGHSLRALLMAAFASKSANHGVGSQGVTLLMVSLSIATRAPNLRTTSRFRTVLPSPC